MPKLIEHLRESILQCAKSELLLNGYDALTIRGVAKECGIAVGTVYNYFPSKDMLAASVMLEDWLSALSRMDSACRSAQSVPGALKALYEGISGFYAIYSAVWAGYTFSASAKSAYGKRHNLLVAQLAGCLKPVLFRLAPDAPESIGVFLAENVLICAGNSAMSFDSFLRIVQRILP